MSKILKLAKEIQNELVEHRRFLHKNAEVGIDLSITTTYVKEELTKMGYEPKEIVQSGLLAVLKGKKEGKTILLRADMDALPMKEETDLEYKATNGNMHSCGHDYNTTMLLGAAKILKKYEEEIAGTIKFMFQPAEEKEELEGALSMIRAGILENPKADVSMAMHAMPSLNTENGKLLVPPKGAILSSIDTFDIEVHGKGGHGSSPELTVDANYIMANILLNLQSINSREFPSMESYVLTIGQMHGGTSRCSIPGYAKMEGTLRTFNTDLRDKIVKRIVDIVSSTAEIYGGKAELKLIAAVPALMVDEEVSKYSLETFKLHVGAEDVIPYEEVEDAPINASDDFAYIAKEVPSIHVLITCIAESDGEIYPLHHPKVKFDDSYLYLGATAYASFAYENLKLK